MKRKAAWLVFGLSCLTDLAMAQPNSTFAFSPDQLTTPCLHGMTEECEGRTFGLGRVVGRRRMAMMFLPVMFLLGVIMTLLVTLTVMASQGLTIGLALLYFALTSKHRSGSQHRADDEGAPPVHVHLHNRRPPHRYRGPGPYDSERYWERYPDFQDNIGPQYRRSSLASPYAYYRPYITIG